MQQQTQTSNAGGGSASESTPVQKIAENPNPRANENIKHTQFDDKETEPGNDVGTEITDGEGG